ncbi:hypothetical protein BV22DRAFT_1127199 [Leucogyrophana mollusca]|uniref:Uncharacterized protein n=1 Tax=Leucogyrophana mollusca TaxID=85980 RepID=A0ACB8BNZ5_9AGAM|nr:hypothetical protein BV22DRAFT_1127199 [Leucogyrophana mollusca]
MSHYRPSVYQYPTGGSMQYPTAAQAPQQLYPISSSATHPPLVNLASLTTQPSTNAFTGGAYPGTLFSAPGTIFQQAINDPTKWPFAYPNATSQQFFYAQNGSVQPIYQAPAVISQQVQVPYLASKYPPAPDSTTYISPVTLQQSPQNNNTLAYPVNYAIPASIPVAYNTYPQGYGSTPSISHGQDGAQYTPGAPPSPASSSSSSSSDPSPPPPYDVSASFSDASTMDNLPAEDSSPDVGYLDAPPTQRPRRPYNKKATTIDGGMTKLNAGGKTCPLCGKVVSGNLTRHMATHRKELRVPCPSCGHFFARTDAVKRHLRGRSCKGPKKPFASRKKENWVIERPGAPSGDTTTASDDSWPAESVDLDDPTQGTACHSPVLVSVDTAAHESTLPFTSPEAADSTTLPSDGQLTPEQLEAFLRIMNEMSAGGQSTAL